HLEEIASTGVCFDRAVATAPWTLPSHASMFTGHFPHEQSADWQRALDSKYPTLAEVLSARGYRTAGFVANVVYCERSAGVARGFAHYEDFLFSWERVARSSHLACYFADKFGLWPCLPEAHKDAGRVNHEFLKWLDAAGAGPFFVFLNYMDAHDPYVAPVPFKGRFSSKTPTNLRVSDGTARS